MSGTERMGQEAGVPTGSVAWLSACWQPWEMLNGWNAFWGSQWRSWFDALVSAPNPWLPALADERPYQRADIDFFLPWLPRIDAVITPLDAIGGRNAVRVMLRAAPPFAGTPSASDWLNVDATVTRGRRLEDSVPLESPAEAAVLEPDTTVLPLRAKAEKVAARTAPARRARKPLAASEVAPVIEAEAAATQAAPAKAAQKADKPVRARRTNKRSAADLPPPDRQGTKGE